jgi:uncharacterized protein (TIGR03067 family)
MIARTIAYACALFALSASAAENDNRELEKLQGEWALHVSEHKGKTIAPRHPRTMVIKGSEYSFDSNGQQQKVAFTIDPTKEPKHFDRSLEGGTVISRGIYKLEGDTFTLCRREGDIRPTDFATTGKSGAITVWKRVVKRNP